MVREGLVEELEQKFNRVLMNDARLRACWETCRKEGIDTTVMLKWLVVEAADTTEILRTQLREMHEEMPQGRLLAPARRSQAEKAHERRMIPASR